jgi:hypothetical protein
LSVISPACKAMRFPFWISVLISSMYVWYMQSNTSLYNFLSFIFYLFFYRCSVVQVTLKTLSSLGLWECKSKKIPRLRLSHCVHVTINYEHRNILTNL